MFKHHNMKTYGEVGEKLHTFFTSLLYRDERSVSRFYTGKILRLGGPKGKIFTVLRNQTPIPLSSSQYHNHYTQDIPAPPLYSAISYCSSLFYDTVQFGRRVTTPRRNILPLSLSCEQVHSSEMRIST
jgi:hypothetical protein